MPRLTKRFIDSLKVEERDRDYFDDLLKGFGLRVRKTGRKSYFVMTRHKGILRRFTIGAHGPITTEIARNKAKEIIADIVAGRTPEFDQKQKRSGPTVKDLNTRFLEEYVPIHLKLSTQKEYRRSIELFINPKIGRFKVKEVQRSDISELHHSLRNTPYQANRVLGVVSKTFNQAELWGLRPDGSNPCRHVKKFKEEKRERFLSMEELQRLGQSLNEEEKIAPYAVAAYRLLILTGCRLGEIQTLKWKYIDFDQQIIKLPDSKTGEKQIYLTNEAMKVLEKVLRHNDNPYVICGKEPGHYLTDLQKPWRRIRTRANLEDVRIHDLRHTYASNAVSLGQSLPMIGKLLGHTQVQTTARYAHLADDPVRAAASQVAQHVANMIFGQK